MRIPNSYRDRTETMDAKMTPMIDVVFLLLIFFVWTASFQLVEYRLPSRVTDATAAGDSMSELDPEIVDYEQVIVQLRWTGNTPAWTVNERPLRSIEEVRATLTSVGLVKSDLPVILDSVGDAPMRYVIELYDVARLAGFQTVNFATPVAR